MTRDAAIITAGGQGLRMGGSRPKQFLMLAGRPLFIHTIETFVQTELFAQIILVVPKDYLELSKSFLSKYHLQQCLIVAGGKTRQDSVRNGLLAVQSHIDLVAVHDGVRPFVSRGIIQNCLKQARICGAAIAAVPVKDTLKRSIDSELIQSTVAREGLWQAQTPQVARRSLFDAAFQQADQEGFLGTDEASLLEHAGHPVALVFGSEKNIKITRPEDLELAEKFMSRESAMGTAFDLRIGHGFDAHGLTAGRKLILGGIEIPYEKGLLGHSDADVLTHAFCDGILGALGKGDLGKHFPDSDAAFKGISSLQLLAQVMTLMKNDGYTLVNADLTVVAQQPKLASHISLMRDRLAEICGTDSSRLNIKATTTEKMGYTGRGEGISSHAVVLLAKG